MPQVPRYFGFSAASTSFSSDLDRVVDVGFLLMLNTLLFYLLLLDMVIYYASTTSSLSFSTYIS